MRLDLRFRLRGRRWRHRNIGRLDGGWSGTAPLIGQHRSNRLEILFRIVFKRDVFLFHRLTDHDQSASG